MIGLNHRNYPPPPWGHIANISSIDVDLFGEISDLYIYEAKGHTDTQNPGPLNLIGYENGKYYYIDRGYNHKCIRWDY